MSDGSKHWKVSMKVSGPMPEEGAWIGAYLQLQNPTTDVGAVYEYESFTSSVKVTKDTIDKGKDFPEESFDF